MRRARNRDEEEEVEKIKNSNNNSITTTTRGSHRNEKIFTNMHEKISESYSDRHTYLHHT